MGTNQLLHVSLTLNSGISIYSLKEYLCEKTCLYIDNIFLVICICVKKTTYFIMVTNITHVIINSSNQFMFWGQMFVGHLQGKRVSVIKIYDSYTSVFRI